MICFNLLLLTVKISFMGFLIAFIFVELLAVSALGWPVALLQIVCVAAIVIADDYKKKGRF